MGCHASEFWDCQKACLAMVFMQLLYAGMALLSKAALNNGMGHLVFVVYRQAIATITLAPFVHIYERGEIPPLPFIAFCKVFLLALCGLTLSMDLYHMALRHTSATFASTTSNIILAMTFLTAVLLRIESVDLRRRYGQLKIIGVVLCIGGALVLSLYKGPPFKLFNWHSYAAPPPGASVVVSHVEDKAKFIEGPLLMFAAITSWSLWLAMQVEMLKAYPAKLWITTLQCLLSTIQSAVVAIALDRYPNSWKLRWGIQLFSLLYCIWCIEKGPVYVAMFSPLSVSITAILSALIWAELLYFGSIMGGLLIIGGLYCVLWGKRKEAGHGRVQNEGDPNPPPQRQASRFREGWNTQRKRPRHGFNLDHWPLC